MHNICHRFRITEVTIYISITTAQISSTTTINQCQIISNNADDTSSCPFHKVHNQWPTWQHFFIFKQQNVTYWRSKVERKRRVKYSSLTSCLKLPTQQPVQTNLHNSDVQILNIPTNQLVGDAVKVKLYSRCTLEYRQQLFNMFPKCGYVNMWMGNVQERSACYEDAIAALADWQQLLAHWAVQPSLYLLPPLTECRWCLILTAALQQAAHADCSHLVQFAAAAADAYCLGLIT